ncbi:SDR family oxidoreductase [Natronosalvus rutilus]|uniref:SDR family oxidoreductase n=1 Tax=Natronosalvus rutilus TaxID=2953753 RepID=A0A9E7SWS1_9EURY|nr:SDR family oxidoreductase [Natronosalvus rutilus]UTF55750.1 SDR family oxidoreductase [Natronosalvus rutilus]
MNGVALVVVATSVTHDDLGMLNAGGTVKFRNTIPIGRVGTPQGIGDAVCYLVSSLADFDNGERLVVDGATTNTQGIGSTDDE